VRTLGLVLALSAMLTTAGAGAQPNESAAELVQIRAELERLLERVDRLEQQNVTLAAENEALRVAAREGSTEMEALKGQTWVLTEQSAAAGKALEGLQGAQWAGRLTFRGDLRYRHEDIWDDAATPGGTQVTADRYRDRLRVRVGLEARPTENVTASVQFATAENGDPRSPNQSLDGTFSRKAIDLDQAFFDWRYASWGHLIGGKMRMPFFRPGQSTFFDGDLNPEGLALTFSHGVGFGSAYRFWLDEVSGAEIARTADAMLHGVQVGVRFPIGASTLILAAHYYDLAAGQGRRGLFYGCSATSDACANGNTTTGPAGAGVLAHDFNVLNVSTQFNTTLGSRPLQLWGEVNENDDPADLNLAWAAGFLYGAAANAGTWEAGAAYQSMEKDALFGQFVDSDFGGGTTDSRGWIVRAGYAPLRNWVLNATYFMNQRNMDVGTLSDYDRLQLDFNLRF